jgi:hypothetical protein
MRLARLNDLGNRPLTLPSPPMGERDS